jgi:hypothetical protein
VGRFRHLPWLAHTGMRQHEAVVDVAQGRCCCLPSAPWHRVLTRRPTAATRWRMSRWSRSIQEVVVFQRCTLVLPPFMTWSM